MRLSQEEEDFEVVLFGEGDNYEVDFAEGGKMSPFTLTMEKILVYCHEHVAFRSPSSSSRQLRQF